MNHRRTMNNNAQGLSDRDVYLQRFHASALSTLIKGRRGRIQKDDCDDIASRMVLRVLPKLDDYRRRYPKPETLANVMAGQFSIDFRRSEGAQRGEGARLARQVAQLDSVLVTWVDADASFMDSTVKSARQSRAHSEVDKKPAPGVRPEVDSEGRTRALRQRRHFKPELAESLTAMDFPSQNDSLDAEAAAQVWPLMEAALLARGVDQRGRWLLEQVDGQGRTVTEAATELNVTRETAQRALGKARQAARAEADQWRADGRAMPW